MSLKGYLKSSQSLLEGRCFPPKENLQLLLLSAMVNWNQLKTQFMVWCFFDHPGKREFWQQSLWFINSQWKVFWLFFSSLFFLPCFAQCQSNSPCNLLKVGKRGRRGGGVVLLLCSPLPKRFTSNQFNVESRCLISDRGGTWAVTTFLFI